MTTPNPSAQVSATASTCAPAELLPAPGPAPSSAPGAKAGEIPPARVGFLSRLAASSGDAASTDSWFWRRWNIYGTEFGCFCLLGYILTSHLASIHSVLGQFIGSGAPATQADSLEAEQFVWWAFSLWTVALLIHVFGPGAEKILLSVAQLIAAKLGVKLPEGATQLTATSTTSTVTATALPQQGS